MYSALSGDVFELLQVIVRWYLELKRKFFFSVGPPKEDILVLPQSVPLSFSNAIKIQLKVLLLPS